MENEEMKPSYWPSVIQAAIIIGVIMVVIGLISQYMTISSEPTGAQFNMSQLVGIFSCLIAAIGGIIATRQYAKNNDVTFPIGTGALIGFLTGFIGVLISSVINLIWTFIVDPNLNQQVYDWQIANLEAQNLPDAQLDLALSFIPEPGSMATILWGILILILAIGIVNTISGMIGAKIFASEE